MDEAMEVVEMATGNTGNQNLIVILLILLVAIVFVVEYLQRFKNLFGLQTKWDIREENEQKSIRQLEQEVNAIKKEIDSLKDSECKDHAKCDEFQRRVCKSLDEIKRDRIEEKIQRYRSEILDFCNACQNRDYSEESFQNIFAIFSVYEELLQSIGKQNGQVDAGMAYVKKKYAEYLEKGFPTYGGK